MTVQLVWATPDADNVIAYCARVSNPANQDNPSIERLIRYCARHSHWSVFEMAGMCVEITASRIIIDQIARHRSFSFQIFSTRYAEVERYVPTNPRRQDTKNRQNSIDDLDIDTERWFREEQSRLWYDALNTYERALNLGIAKENARDLLPVSQESRMYMAGTVRSWIHYLDLRTGNGTQEEHRQIAESIKAIFVKTLPVTAGAIWGNDDN